MKHHGRLIHLLIVTCCSALLFSAAFASAQSGRHVKKSTPYPVPTPEPTPTPTRTPEKPKPAFTFIVGLDRMGNFSRISLGSYDGVVRSCAQRLGDAPSVRAEPSTTDMSRSDALRKAKAEKDIHVVWLQLQHNNFRGQEGVYDDPYDVRISYAVFEPVTGKQVTSGYKYPYRSRRIRVPSTGDGDYYLNEAARGAAERILDHFKVHLP